MARNVLDVAINKVDAWLAGKNPWITVPNPDPDNRKAPMVRVKANKFWGNPKGTGDHSPKGNLVT